MREVTEYDRTWRRDFIMAVAVFVFFGAGIDIRDQLFRVAHPQQVKYDWCMENSPRVYDNFTAERLDRVCFLEAMK